MAGAVFMALWQSALPVGMIAFALVWWALEHEYFGTSGSVGELERQVKQHLKSRKKNRKDRKRLKKARKSRKTSEEDLARLECEVTPAVSRKMNPVHDKWLSFGGGFYGVVALLTYAVIELIEIRDWLYNFSGLLDFFRNISFGMLVQLLINSLMNFIWAIVWPVYWLDNINSHYPWVWLIAAYAGYWAGSRLAFRLKSKS